MLLQVRHTCRRAAVSTGINHLQRPLPREVRSFQKRIFGRGVTRPALCLHRPLPEIDIRVDVESFLSKEALRIYVDLDHHGCGYFDCFQPIANCPLQGNSPRRFK